jgi:hypothetical protein
MALLAQAPSDPAEIVGARLEESARLAAEWVHSPDTRVRAWGAHLALRDRHTVLLPRLVELVGRYAASTAPAKTRNAAEHASMVSVLDAIIQLDGRIPASDAARLYSEFPTPALILLSHGQPAADTFLLDIFRKEDAAIGAWTAAGNLLVNRPPPGFAALVLGQLTVEARVRVIDAASPNELPRGVAGSCLSGMPQPTLGWPLVGNYYISTRGMLLAAGTVPMYYVRVVSGPDFEGPRAEFPCVFHFLQDWNRMREGWLARLAGEGDVPSVRASVVRTIDWRSHRQYLRELRDVIDREQAQFAALAKKLVASGALNEQERVATAPTLRVHIEDARTVRSSPLPRPQNVSRNVTIVN